MAENPIVFAMANPTPEIKPEEVEDIVGVIVPDVRTIRTRLIMSSVSPGFSVQPWTAEQPPLMRK